MTPLERAARAIWEGFGRPEPGWERFIPTVQNVLLAIREPSEAMIRAAEARGEELNAQWDAGTDPETVWPIMIDAALEEGDQ